MNDMAMVKYLLRQYAEAEIRKEKSTHNKEMQSFFEGVMAAARSTINKCFGMDVIEVGRNRYYAYNTVYCVSVRKGILEEADND